MLSYLGRHVAVSTPLGCAVEGLFDGRCGLSEELKQACFGRSDRLDRPIQYLPHRDPQRRTRPANTAGKPVSEASFVCSPRGALQHLSHAGNRQTHRLELRAEQTKWLHLYKY